MAEKKYIIDNPNLMAEWDWEKNNLIGLDPAKLSYGSGKKAFWICKEGHSWSTAIYGRSSGNGCPTCSYRNRGNSIRVTKNVGKKTFAEEHPDLLIEWDHDRNITTSPYDVTSHSSYRVWWKCQKGHSWQAPINNRTSGNNGCPFCSNQRVLVGFNDLLSQNYPFISEWNYERNDIQPSELYYGSTKKIWWKCSVCAHEWQATIRHRKNGSGCPKCAREMQSSFPEQAIYFYIKKHFPLSINGYKDILSKISEIDIYIPELKIGIEYDGKYYHSTEKQHTKDLRKYKTLKTNGIILIRVVERLDNFATAPQDICDYSVDFTYTSDYRYLSKAIIEIFALINEISNAGIECDIDIDNDKVGIYEQYFTYRKSNTLQSKFPLIASEWHPTKNGSITPSHISPVTAKKFWFICPKGHEYESRVSDRTNNNSGCPYCSNQKVLEGFNDLATTHPVLLLEWDYLTNAILPTQITYGTTKKVNWICSKCGHSWSASVSHRATGIGCPQCKIEKLKGHRTPKNNTDLQTVAPQVAQEWNYEKNAPLTPCLISSGSNKIVWWICSKGHEWEAAVSKRVSGRNCPYCSNQRILVGYNDLQTTSPELAIQWHKEKNGALTPQMVTRGSGKKVWWHCDLCGNDWEATVQKRAIGQGCPHCRKARGKKPKND